MKPQNHVNMQSTESPTVVVVIPALNEAASIGSIIEGAMGVLSYLKNTILVVDGHSSDGTDVIARNKGAVVVYQRVNGYGDALRTGFQYARKTLHADCIVIIDADSTYDVKDIPIMIQPILDDEAELVIGNRFPRMDHGAMPFVNRLGNNILSWFARRSLRISVHDTQCGIRAFKAEVVDLMDLETEGMSFAVEMLAEAKFAGARIVEVPVAYRVRVGQSKLVPPIDGIIILTTIIRLMRDTQPLLFFGGFSLIFGISGLYFAVDVTLEWLRTGTITRLPTVMLSVLLLVFSVQFFSTGLMADMLKKLRRKKWI